MSDELKSCPFCGGEAIPPKHDHSRMWVIRCKGCNIELWEKNDGHFEADFIPMIISAWNARAPVSVQEAAKVLLGNRAVLDRMVDVAEDIHGTGVSFNRVVGDALRAIAEGGEA